jgi:hypothetical protein
MSRSLRTWNFWVPNHLGKSYVSHAIIFSIRFTSQVRPSPKMNLVGEGWLIPGANLNNTNFHSNYSISFTVAMNKKMVISIVTTPIFPSNFHIVITEFSNCGPIAQRFYPIQKVVFSRLSKESADLSTSLWSKRQPRPNLLVDVSLGLRNLGWKNMVILRGI